MIYQLINEETTYKALSNEKSSLYCQNLIADIVLDFAVNHTINLGVGFTLVIRSLESMEVVCKLQIAYMYNVNFKELSDMEASLAALEDAFLAFILSFKKFTADHDDLFDIPLEKPDYEEILEDIKEKMRCKWN